jgi:hypothetical protein
MKKVCISDSATPRGGRCCINSRRCVSRSNADDTRQSLLKAVRSAIQSRYWQYDYESPLSRIITELCSRLCSAQYCGKHACLSLPALKLASRDKSGSKRQAELACALQMSYPGALLSIHLLQAMAPSSLDSDAMNEQSRSAIIKKVVGAFLYVEPVTLRDLEYAHD